eukprot:gene16113-22256_t
MVEGRLRCVLQATSELAKSFVEHGTCDLKVAQSTKIGRNVARGDGYRLKQEWTQFSQNHCRIYCEQSTHEPGLAWFIEDTSTNGTWVNDVRLAKRTPREIQASGIGVLPGYTFISVYEPTTEQRADNDSILANATGVQKRKASVVEDEPEPKTVFNTFKRNARPQSISPASVVEDEPEPQNVYNTVKRTARPPSMSPVPAPAPAHDAVHTPSRYPGPSPLRQPGSGGRDHSGMSGHVVGDGDVSAAALAQFERTNQEQHAVELLASETKLQESDKKAEELYVEKLVALGAEAEERYAATLVALNAEVAASKLTAANGLARISDLETRLSSEADAKMHAEKLHTELKYELEDRQREVGRLRDELDTSKQRLSTVRSERDEFELRRNQEAELRTRLQDDVASLAQEISTQQQALEISTQQQALMGEKDLGAFVVTTISDIASQQQELVGEIDLGAMCGNKHLIEVPTVATNVRFLTISVLDAAHLDNFNIAYFLTSACMDAAHRATEHAQRQVEEVEAKLALEVAARSSVEREGAELQSKLQTAARIHDALNEQLQERSDSSLLQKVRLGKVKEIQSALQMSVERLFSDAMAHIAGLNAQVDQALTSNASAEEEDAQADRLAAHPPRFAFPNHHLPQGGGNAVPHTAPPNFLRPTHEVEASGASGSGMQAGPLHALAASLHAAPHEAVPMKDDFRAWVSPAPPMGPPTTGQAPSSWASPALPMAPPPTGHARSGFGPTASPGREGQGGPVHMEMTQVGFDAYPFPNANHFANRDQDQANEDQDQANEDQDQANEDQGQANEDQDQANAEQYSYADQCMTQVAIEMPFSREEIQPPPPRSGSGHVDDAQPPSLSLWDMPEPQPQAQGSLETTQPEDGQAPQAPWRDQPARGRPGSPGPGPPGSLETTQPEDGQLASCPEASMQSPVRTPTKSTSFSPHHPVPPCPMPSAPVSSQDPLVPAQDPQASCQAMDHDLPDAQGHESNTTPTPVSNNVGDHCVEDLAAQAPPQVRNGHCFGALPPQGGAEAIDDPSALEAMDEDPSEQEGRPMGGPDVPMVATAGPEQEGRPMGGADEPMVAAAGPSPEMQMGDPDVHMVATAGPGPEMRSNGLSPTSTEPGASGADPVPQHTPGAAPGAPGSDPVPLYTPGAQICLEKYSPHPVFEPGARSSLRWEESLSTGNLVPNSALRSSAQQQPVDGQAQHPEQQQATATDISAPNPELGDVSIGSAAIDVSIGGATIEDAPIDRESPMDADPKPESTAADGQQALSDREQTGAMMDVHAQQVERVLGDATGTLADGDTAQEQVLEGNVQQAIPPPLSPHAAMMDVQEQQVERVLGNVTGSLADRDTAQEQVLEANAQQATPPPLSPHAAMMEVHEQEAERIPGGATESLAEGAAAQELVPGANAQQATPPPLSPHRIPGGATESLAEGAAALEQVPGANAIAQQAIALGDATRSLAHGVTALEQLSGANAQQAGAASPPPSPHVAMRDVHEQEMEGVLGVTTGSVAEGPTTQAYVPGDVVIAQQAGATPPPQAPHASPYPPGSAQPRWAASGAGVSAERGSEMDVGSEGVSVGRGGEVDVGSAGERSGHDSMGYDEPKPPGLSTWW